MEFAPVVSLEVDVLGKNVGRRYADLFEADQTATNYWRRALLRLSARKICPTTSLHHVVNYRANHLNL